MNGAQAKRASWQAPILRLFRGAREGLVISLFILTRPTTAELHLDAATSRFFIGLISVNVLLANKFRLNTIVLLGLNRLRSAAGHRFYQGLT